MKLFLCLLQFARETVTFLPRVSKGLGEENLTVYHPSWDIIYNNMYSIALPLPSHPLLIAWLPLKFSYNK
jgi:hypothetical protein